MNKIVRIVICVLLLPVIAGLVWLNVRSVSQPVEFNKQKEIREAVGIQRLKDIRDLQVAYKTVTGKYVSTVDSLVDFYNTGKMEVILQFGSADDSLAVATTEKIKKKNRKITNQDLYKLFLEGEVVYGSIKSEIAVKDTLFRSRENFVADSLKYIPFSGGEPVEMDAIVKLVSGVNVPLFEAKMPYKLLLKGLDNQLRINLDDERRTQNRYEGLQVGSISAPNNNAGNWE